MIADSGLGEPKPGGDRFGADTFAEQLEHDQFPRAEGLLLTQGRAAQTSASGRMRTKRPRYVVMISGAPGVSKRPCHSSSTSRFGAAPQRHRAG